MLAGILLTGCAALDPPDTSPPVPIGPAGSAPVAHHSSEVTATPPPVRVSVPPPSGRSPGWDTPDLPGTRTEPTAQSMVMDEEILRLQITMDRENISPGCLDGRMGHQSRMALRTWQRRNGLAVTGEIDDAVRTRLIPPGDAFSAHTVSAADHVNLAPVPRSWAAKAAASELSYATVLEKLAEQYHLTQRALKELNPTAAWPDPAVGAVLRVPRVEGWTKIPIARIEIHLAGKYLQGFGYDGALVAHFPCSIAKDKAKRPMGELHVSDAAENPNYTFKPELFAEDAEAARITQRLIIPPGPNNPVGVAWLSLDRPGYGIHGTPHPEDIGRTESHGCFRLANWNARKLLSMISIGIPVTVFE